MTEFPNANRTKAGDLIASDIEIGACDSCDCIHIELKDRYGKVFATAVIDPANNMPMATKIVQLHDHLADRRIKKVLQQ